MPLPILRRYSGTNIGKASPAWSAVTPAIPAARALVVSKITVVNNSGANCLFYLAVSTSLTTPTDPDVIASNITLSPGELYTETGIIVPAGQALLHFNNTTNIGSILATNVFGEEVDN